MDEYADIYYVDSARNASNDHRTGGVGPIFGAPGRPVPPPVGGVPSSLASRTVYVRPPAQPMVYSGPYAYPAQYPYGAPAPQSTLGGLLGNLTAGTLVELVAQAIAALQSLPAAPVATKDVGTDVGNMILFQGALAQHAKRDEQLRTIGHLVAKLVG